jgi:hypothetical protein
VHLGWRDTDGDGTLDPVDPVSNPQVNQNRLCRRYPLICDFFKLFGLSQAPSMAESAHENMPLYQLRRILTAEEMTRVEAYLDREEDQYLEALAKKLSSAATEIRSYRRKDRRTPITK